MGGATNSAVADPHEWAVIRDASGELLKFVRLMDVAHSAPDTCMLALPLLNDPRWLRGLLERGALLRPAHTLPHTTHIRLARRGAREPPLLNSACVCNYAQRL